MNTDYLELFGALKPTAQKLVDEYIDAKEYGSILTPNIDRAEFERVKEKYFEIEQAYFDNVFDTAKRKGLHKLFPALILQTEIMQKKYNVVCTNPPYMGGSGMSAKLSTFVKKYYPDSKADLFAVFMEKCNDYTARGCYTAMITMHSWMFLSSFEKLRQKLLLQTTVNMAHLGARAFDQIGGEVVQVTTFVNRKNHIKDYLTTYKRLIEQNTENAKREAFLTADRDYTANADNFSKIPGSPIAYWVSKTILSAFENGIFFKGETKKGVLTGKNDLFLRLWFEVKNEKIGFELSNHNEMLISKKKWFPVTSGGFKRKWYGNFDTIVNLENDGFAIRTTVENYRLRDPQYYMREAVTWTEVSSGIFTCRYVPKGVLFGNGGPVSFFNNNDLLYHLGLLNSNVVMAILQYLAPTINYGPEQINKIPLLVQQKKFKHFIIKE